MTPLHIIKIGGNIIDDPEKLSAFLSGLVRLPEKKLLIHGGGKLASSMSARLGIPTQMHNGRRITDSQTLQVVTMVYAGWINKSIVAALNALGGNAIGLSGADAQLLPAEKRPVRDVDYGFAGDIIQEAVGVNFIADILEAGLLPVIAPITADKRGQLLNTNADTIASSLAVALAQLYKVSLVYCFEKKGVLLDVSNDDSYIKVLDRSSFEDLKSKGIIDKGMIPKLDNAFSALTRGVHRVIIGHATSIVSLTSQEQPDGTIIQ